MDKDSNQEQFGTVQILCHWVSTERSENNTNDALKNSSDMADEK